MRIMAARVRLSRRTSMISFLKTARRAENLKLVNALTPLPQQSYKGLADVGGAGGPPQLFGTALGNDRTLVDENYTGTNVFGFLHVMGGIHHALAPGALGLHEPDDGIAAEDVQAQGGLVKYVHLRCVDE